MSTEQNQPLLEVVAGSPSDDELAALTAVVLALAGDGSPERPTGTGGWADLSLRLRRPRSRNRPRRLPNSSSSSRRTPSPAG